MDTKHVYVAYRICWAVITVLGIAAGWVAGLASAGHPVVSSATGVLAIGGTLTLAATLFVAGRGQSALDPESSRRTKADEADSRWRVVAFDELGRAMDLGQIRNAAGPIAGLPDVIVVARRSALPVVDPENPAESLRPDDFGSEDVAEQFEVEFSPLGEVLDALSRAELTSRRLNSDAAAGVRRTQ